MEDLYKETVGKKDEYIDENEGLKNLKDIEDPAELEIAEKLLDEEIDKLSGEEKQPSEGEESEVSDEETDDEEKESAQPSLINDEFIQAQPEEKRESLAQFKGKSKDELIDIVAKSIAEKTPLGGSEKTINTFKEQLSEKTNEELLQIISGTDYKAPGKTIEKEIQSATTTKLELPELPKDDPEIQKALERETLKRLKATYPSMPDVDSMESEAYKEWRRDFNIDNPDNIFKDDLIKAKTEIESELSRVIYIQKELPNLFEKGPEEVLPLLVPQNLPRLKKLNDDPMGLLVDDLQSEIETIRSGLKKYGLTEKDLEMDFSITKDEKGMPFNKVFNDLITAGKTEDGTLIPSEEIIGQRGKTFWLKRGTLARKFKEEFDDKILTAFVAKKTQTNKMQKEKLKTESMIEASGKGGSSNSKKIYSLDQIKQVEDDKVLDKIIADLED